MLKTAGKLKTDDFEATAEKDFISLLAQVPFIRIESHRKAVSVDGEESDLLVKVTIDGKPWRLLVETRMSGQPRHIRSALSRLEQLNARQSGGAVYCLIAAPFLSPQSISLCRDAGVGYFDLAGNAWLSFDHVFIERQAADNPFKVVREQRSLFTRKAGRMLRVMLTPPLRRWTVVELSTEASISLGQVSNVRKLLLDRELAHADRDGLKLSRPEELARQWQVAYKLNAKKQSMYTLLHGEALDTAIRSALSAAGRGQHAVLGSFSAARWIAPYARQVTQYFYADSTGEQRLKASLGLQPAGEGANVVILSPDEDDVFSSRIEPAPGIWCTGLVQTWLDLSAAGERGREAAEHLFTEKLLPEWWGSEMS